MMFTLKLILFQPYQKQKPFTTNFTLKKHNSVKVSILLNIRILTVYVSPLIIEINNIRNSFCSHLKADKIHSLIKVKHGQEIRASYVGQNIFP